MGISTQMFSVGVKKHDSALLKEVRLFESEALKTAAPVKKNLITVRVPNKTMFECSETH